MERDVEPPYIKLEVMSESEDSNCKELFYFSYHRGVTSGETGARWKKQRMPN